MKLTFLRYQKLGRMFLSGYGTLLARAETLLSVGLTREAARVQRTAAHPPNEKPKHWLSANHDRKRSEPKCRQDLIAQHSRGKHQHKAGPLSCMMPSVTGLAPGSNSRHPAFPWSANPSPLGPLASDEPSPVGGPTRSPDCECGMISWISIALGHDLCAGKCAAHRNQLITLVHSEHTAFS